MNSGFYYIKCYLFNNNSFIRCDYTTYVNFVEMYKKQNYVDHIQIKQVNNLGYTVVKAVYTYDFIQKFGYSYDVIAYINPNCYRGDFFERGGKNAR